MTKTYETAEHMALPLIALNGIVLFPRISVSFEIHDSKYLRVCTQAADQNAMLFFVTRKESDEKTASVWLEKSNNCLKFRMTVHV